MVLDWVIHVDLSMRFNNEMNTQEGRGQAKEMWPARVQEGENSQSRRMQTTQRIQLRIGNRFAWHFVQWFAQRGPTLFARPATTCPPMGEIASQKTSGTTTAVCS